MGFFLEIPAITEYPLYNTHYWYDIVTGKLVGMQSHNFLDTPTLDSHVLVRVPLGI